MEEVGSYTVLSPLLSLSQGALDWFNRWCCPGPPPLASGLQPHGAGLPSV
jgi:hypothetical protein